MRPDPRWPPRGGGGRGRSCRLALDVKVIKCRFQSKRAQTYTRIQLFPSTFKQIAALNDCNVYAYLQGNDTKYLKIAATVRGLPSKAIKPSSA